MASALSLRTGGLRTVALRLLARAVGGPAAWGVQAQLQQALAASFVQGMADRHPATLGTMEANRSWVFAGNRQVGGRAVRVAPRLEQLTHDRSGKVNTTPLHSHPVLDLLAHPNPDETGMVFHWRAVLQLNTAGRVYIAVHPDAVDLAWLGIPNALTRIARLTLLEPERVALSGTSHRRAAAFDYLDPYGVRTVYPAAPWSPAERQAWRRTPYPFVIRVNYPSPENFNGQSPTAAAEWAIETMFGVSQVWKNQLKNGIHSSLIFYLKNTAGVDEAERFKQAVIMLKAGIGRAGEPMVLPADTLTVDKTPVSMTDLPFDKMSAEARQEILATLGVSEGMVGISRSYNRASIEGIERIAALGTVDPLNGLIADAYTNSLLPLYRGQTDATWLRLTYPSVAVADELTQADRWTKLAGGPIVSPNEARAEMGKGPIADGDKLRQPKVATADGGADNALGTVTGAGVVPTHALAAPAAAPAPAPAAARAAAPPCGCAEPAGAPATPRAAARAAGAPAPTIQPGHPLASAEARQAQWAVLDTARRGHEATFRRALAPIFRRWQDAVLAAVATHGPSTLLRAALLRATETAEPAANPLDDSAWTLALRDAYLVWAADYARATSRRVATEAADALGLGPAETAALVRRATEAAAPAIEAAIAARAGDYADLVSETQRTLTRTAIEDAVADGVQQVALVDVIEETFPTISTAARLRTIASTEASGVSGRALLETATAAAETAQADADDAEAGGDDTTDDDPATDGGDDADAPFAVIVSAPPDLGLQWLSQRDGKVRPSHTAADGRVIALGGVFHLDGCDVQFPGDAETCDDAAELIACRCQACLVPLDGSDVAQDTPNE